VSAAALAEGRSTRHGGVLEGLVNGSAVVAWCFSEPTPHGHRVEGLTLDIRPDGDEIVVHGLKQPVEAAGHADHLLVTGRTGSACTQVLVPAATPGVSLVPMQSVDLTRRFWSVRFDRVRLPLAAVVGEVGGGDMQAALQRRQALVLLAAESVGAMQRSFDMTVEWAFDRYSFGRPLASYQELKHRFADMKMWLEASHAVADAAAAAVDVDAPNASQLALAAAAYVGVTYEHDLHLYLRRVTLNRTMFGTPGLHLRQIADLLIQEGGN
jgi:alkylation response protein AidB-like acyl-CoA dehydrogenase